MQELVLCDEEDSLARSASTLWIPLRNGGGGDFGSFSANLHETDAGLRFEEAETHLETHLGVVSTPGGIVHRSA
jgi:hypothetical protein